MMVSRNMETVNLVDVDDGSFCFYKNQVLFPQSINFQKYESKKSQCFSANLENLKSPIAKKHKLLLRMSTTKGRFLAADWDLAFSAER